MRRIQRIGIVGAGTMGSRIAFACVVRDKQACLYDIFPPAREKAVREVQRLIEERVLEGRLPHGMVESCMPLLSLSSTLQACVSGKDLVFEVVPENVETKRKVFAEIDANCGRETLIGSNSSAIPGSWLIDSTARPDKVFNANFGYPDDRRVEVMGHPGTSPETLETALTFIQDLGLIPILVRGECVGYALNRIWRQIKKEVLYLLEHGYVTPEDIDRGWMLDWGTALGPCGLMDLIGLDVVMDIEMIYFQASGDPSDKPPRFLQLMIAAGKVGVKSGQGFYSYPNPAYQRPHWLNEISFKMHSCTQADQLSRMR
jgi:3-hydroxybutyryl-CoA dehydrogenase